MVVLRPLFAAAIVRGGARCVSQVLHRCAQAVSRGAVRCASQVNDRGVHADAEQVQEHNAKAVLHFGKAFFFFEKRTGSFYVVLFGPGVLFKLSFVLLLNASQMCFELYPIVLLQCY